MGLLTPADVSEEPAAAGTGKRANRFAAGEVVAERYRLIRELGEGGMGVVWVAHSLVLGVDVAIKLIRTGVADVELAGRMAREAQVTATLGHPAIVRVFDFGITAQGDPFLVMELAHGETLAALLDRERRVDAVEALKLILPVVDGLRCAHERGIVHRDIKPENVFIARDALGRLQPKLLDFGIAKLEHVPSVSRLTQVGEVLGSPEFMSPEQARGIGSVDLRTDVWALCVLIYEMLTGTVPFKVKNYNALMQAILHEPPTPTVEYGAGDRELWQIIAKGLEKKREKRWSSMTELGEALAFWLFDHGASEDLAGNSLKAVWLGGTLTGLSTEKGPVAARPVPFGGGVGIATLRLHVRRFRHRAVRALTPTVIAGIGALVVVAIGVLSLRLVRSREAAHGEPHAAAAPAMVRTADVAMPSSGPAADPTSSSASAPPLVSGTKRGGKAPVRTAPAAPGAPRRAVQKAPSKSIRNFGF